MFVKNLGVAAKMRGECTGFETPSAKSSDIVLHDNESFRPQKSFI